MSLDIHHYKVKMEECDTFYFVDDEDAELIRRYSSYIQPRIWKNLPELYKEAPLVIYCDEAGYQRGSVFDQFYAEIRNDIASTEISMARRIHDLTLPQFRNAFKACFLDNWDTERSFVHVSW